MPTSVPVMVFLVVASRSFFKHGLHAIEDLFVGHPAPFSVAFPPSSPDEDPSAALLGAVDCVCLGVRRSLIICPVRLGLRYHF